MTTTAIVVAAARGYLDQTLIALDQQRATPARLIVIDASPHGLDSGYDEAAIPDTVAHEIEVFKAPHAKNLGEAIAIAEADGLRIETEWMWLLHDDSPPHPDALGELQRYVATSPKVGIAGCKQVVLEDPTRLISVGVGYTRAGRRVSGIEPGEIDQGQHDHREDVYAVGSAGMLVRTSTWNHLGGMDPELGPFLDGAELARRARLAGQRVVVVPNAIIRHARASLWHGANRDNPHTDGANSFYSRRLATLYFRLITVRLWAFVAIAVGMILGGVLRGVSRVATTQTTLAW
ncbi:MAG TPA: glycosyltransferase, partial [Beutenbergiaceae bacterium]|nr:glycosyltransferase [Beutenbergiaceae bacterium]